VICDEGNLTNAIAVSNDEERGERREERERYECFGIG